MKIHFHNRRFRLVAISLLSLVLLVALGAIQTVRALEVDADGIIEADEVIDDDVYIEADHVVVDGTVNGVLIIFASEAEINGMVNGDLVMSTSNAKVNGMVTGNLMFGGRTLELNGSVEGSVFAGGSSLTLGSTAVVERNLAFGGFGLEAAEGSVVGRDVRAAGYQAILAGQVDQDVAVDVAALEVEGSVGGDVTASVSEPDPEFSLFQKILEKAQWPGKPEEIAPVGLQVDKEAEIAGTLTYRSSAEQADAIESSAVGEVVYEYVPPKEEPAPTFRHWFVKRLQTFLTLFVLGALVAWRAPILLSQLSHQARTKPLLAALWGLPAIPVIIIGVIALWALIAIAGTLLIVVTLGKLWLSTLLTGTAALALTLSLPALGVLYGTKLIVSYLVGKLILERLAPQIAERTIWPLMLGIVLYVIITSIPCLGHVIGFIVALIGLGAIWLLIRQSRSAPGEIPEEAAAEAIIEASPPVEE